ncbi:MAG: flagellar hook basal-body protein [Gemmatimonadota bacterium]|nr:flagellar hook basal-body protein [Gemmatimonadota bacterium]
MGSSVRPTGLENAAAALRYWERRQEVVANNLANVNTDGFKGERAFARLLDGNTPVVGTTTDLSNGSVNATGNPLDVAISGDGFFVVQTPKGERLSRGGSLAIDADRRIVDANGNQLQGVDAVPVGAKLIAIDAQGRVRADGKDIGRFRIETVPPGTNLQHEGGGQFSTTAARTEADMTRTKVRQGAIEGSNVSSLESMVDMIAVQRAYGAVQKSMAALDAVRGMASAELGKL